MTLQIGNQEHFNRVVEFATKRNILHYLEDRLAYLRTYADPNQAAECVVTLTKDFTPASFNVLWERKGKFWMNGGLIYHGPQEGWGNEEYINPLAVVIGSHDNPWNIHT